MTYKEHKIAILSILGTAILGLLFVPTMATDNNIVFAESIPFALQDKKPLVQIQHQATNEIIRL